VRRDPHAGDLFVFRGRRGDLIKILWHDGLGMSLYAKLTGTRPVYLAIASRWRGRDHRGSCSKASIGAIRCTAGVRTRSDRGTTGVLNHCARSLQWPAIMVESRPCRSKPTFSPTGSMR
jgi:hypothetical protein